MVAWAERRRDIDIAFHVHATRVDPDGTVADPGGFDVSSWGDPKEAPDVAAAPGEGIFSVVYNRIPFGGPQEPGRASFRHVWPK